jgi:AP-3 complex subunit delta
MDCLDSADISIRMRALDLVAGMVSSDNILSIVSRLMRQLRSSSTASSVESVRAGTTGGVQPIADSDDESPEVNIKSNSKNVDANLSLPDAYKTDVIARIIEICSMNNYMNLLDFEWYVDVLIQLIRSSPISKPGPFPWDDSHGSKDPSKTDIAEKVGDELRNVAVKVKAVRGSATRAAESVILASYNGTLSQAGGRKGALRSVAWIAGEYAPYLSSPEDVVTALLQLSKSTSNTEVLTVFLQSVPKILAVLARDDNTPWTAQSKTAMTLLMARIIHTLEPLAMHPDLEVQERAVEFSELLRLTAEASEGQQPSSDAIQRNAPLLLTQAIPSLFAGLELNSIARGAQLNVRMPSTLDLHKPINAQLNELLRTVDSVTTKEDLDEVEVYYHRKSPTLSTLEPAVNRLIVKQDDIVPSYQQDNGDSYLDSDIVERRRTERLERNKDDPFYIAGSNPINALSNPLHNILLSNSGGELDIDSIPILQLDLDRIIPTANISMPEKVASSKVHRRVQVAADETLSTSSASTPRHDDSDTNLDGSTRSRLHKTKHSLLLVDSSNIEAFSLENNRCGDAATSLNHERRTQEEVEMAKAIQDIEKLRLEMQRANERIQAAHGVPPEGTLVKKRARKGGRKMVANDREVKSQEGKNNETGESSEVGALVKQKSRRKAKSDKSKQSKEADRGLTETHGGP